MCFHPYSDLSLPLMDLKDIQLVIQEWITQYDELSKKYPWIQVSIDTVLFTSQNKLLFAVSWLSPHLS